MQSKATTVREYLESLPSDRRALIATVRDFVRQRLDPRIAEGMQYGMIGWSIPHSVYPAGYHVNPSLPLPYVSLASQKNYCALYLMNIYADGTAEERWFREAWTKTGKKLDMGKCCLRFKRLEDLSLEVLGEALDRATVERHVAAYAAVDPRNRAKPAAQQKPTAGKPAAKKSAPKKTASKKAAPKK